MSFSHQLQTIKNPSRNAIAVQNRGTKRSSDMQYEDALKFLMMMQAWIPILIGNIKEIYQK